MALLGPKGHLFSAVRRQVEGEHSEKGDAHAGDDEVDRVEERLASHRHVERDVEVGLVAARVVLDVPDGGNLQNVPLDAHVELGQVDADLDLGPTVLLVDVTQVNLKQMIVSFSV